MANKIKIGDRIHHMKYGETTCSKYVKNSKGKEIIVGKNGIYAPPAEWIKLSSNLPQ